MAWKIVPAKTMAGNALITINIESFVFVLSGLGNFTVKFGDGLQFIDQRGLAGRTKAIVDVDD